jgi:nickel/cobalt transporter (NicO) family protein
LAVVLTGIGLLMVYARRLFERYTFEAKVPRLLPVASAAVITLAGAAIALAALQQAGVV